MHQHSIRAFSGATRVRLRVAVLLALAASVTVGPAVRTEGLDEVCPPTHTKTDHRLHARLHQGGTATRRVIVRVAAGRRLPMRSFLRMMGGTALADFRSIEAITVDLPERALEALTRHGYVVSIADDAPVASAQTTAPGDSVEVLSDAGELLAQRTTSDSTTSTAGPRHLRQTLPVDGLAWNGAGVGVAVIDSGIAPVQDVAGRILAFYDFTQGGVAAPPSDDFGHGTHVASLIGGAGKPTAQKEYEGVAPGVRLIGLKVLDGTGAGRTSNVIAALEFAIANRRALGIDIINMSLGHPIYESAATDPLVAAVEAASRAGLKVVVSAGNYGMLPNSATLGWAGITSPGNAPSAITIGSLKTKNTTARGDDRVADYSSRGPTWYDGFAKPDLLAPGDKLVAAAAPNSSLWLNHPTLRIEPGYMRLSGTSMAAGVASGVVALMLQAHRETLPAPGPPLTVNAIKAVLQYTAIAVRDDTGAVPLQLAQGAGAINAAGAVLVGRAIDTTRSVGSLWLDPALLPSSNSTVIANEAVVWGNSIVWGSTLAWGDILCRNVLALSDDAVVWGNSDDAVVWGNSDDAVVWGNTDAVVWGNAMVWGNAVVWGNSLVGTTEGTAVVWGNGAQATSTTVAWGNLATR